MEEYSMSINFLDIFRSNFFNDRASRGVICEIFGFEFYIKYL